MTVHIRARDMVGHMLISGRRADPKIVAAIEEISNAPGVDVLTRLDSALVKLRAGTEKSAYAGLGGMPMTDDGKPNVGKSNVAGGFGSRVSNGIDMHGSRVSNLGSRVSSRHNGAIGQGELSAQNRSTHPSLTLQKASNSHNYTKLANNNYSSVLPGHFTHPAAKLNERRRPGASQLPSHHMPIAHMAEADKGDKSRVSSEKNAALPQMGPPLNPMKTLIGTASPTAQITPPEPPKKTAKPQPAQVQPMQTGSGPGSVVPKMASIIPQKSNIGEATVDYTPQPYSHSTPVPSNSPIGGLPHNQASQAENSAVDLGALPQGHSQQQVGDISGALKFLRQRRDATAAARAAEQKVWAAKYGTPPQASAQFFKNAPLNSPPKTASNDGDDTTSNQVKNYSSKEANVFGQQTGPAYNMHKVQFPTIGMSKMPFSHSDRFSRDRSDMSDWSKTGMDELAEHAAVRQITNIIKTGGFWNTLGKGVGATHDWIGNTVSAGIEGVGNAASSFAKGYGGNKAEEQPAPSNANSESDGDDFQKRWQNAAGKQVGTKLLGGGAAAGADAINRGNAREQAVKEETGEAPPTQPTNETPEPPQQPQQPQQPVAAEQPQPTQAPQQQPFTPLPTYPVRNPQLTNSAGKPMGSSVQLSGQGLSGSLGNYLQQQRTAGQAVGGMQQMGPGGVAQSMNPQQQQLMQQQLMRMHPTMRNAYMQQMQQQQSMMRRPQQQQSQQQPESPNVVNQQPAAPGVNAQPQAPAPVPQQPAAPQPAPQKPAGGGTQVRTQQKPSRGAGLSIRGGSNPTGGKPSGGAAPQMA